MFAGCILCYQGRITSKLFIIRIWCHKNMMSVRSENSTGITLPGHIQCIFKILSWSRFLKNLNDWRFFLKSLWLLHRKFIVIEIYPTHFKVWEKLIHLVTTLEMYMYIIVGTHADIVQECWLIVFNKICENKVLFDFVFYT